jgi:hypothetical protein
VGWPMTGYVCSRGSGLDRARQLPGIRAAGHWLVVVPAAADRVTGDPEQSQDHADHDGDDADRPDNGDFGDKADNEEDDAKDNQNRLPVNGCCPGSGRRQQDIRMFSGQTRLPAAGATRLQPDRSPPRPWRDNLPPGLSSPANRAQLAPETAITCKHHHRSRSRVIPRARMAAHTNLMADSRAPSLSPARLRCARGTPDPAQGCCLVQPACRAWSSGSGPSPGSEVPTVTNPNSPAGIPASRVDTRRWWS